MVSFRICEDPATDGGFGSGGGSAARAVGSSSAETRLTAAIGSKTAAIVRKRPALAVIKRCLKEALQKASIK